MLRYYIILICLSYSVCRCKMLFEGSKCTRGDLQGRCVSAYKCLTAVVDVAKEDFPPICSFGYEEPIICCTDCELINDTRLLLFNPKLGKLTRTGTSKAKDKCIEYIHKLNYPCKEKYTEALLSKTTDTERGCTNFYQERIASPFPSSGLGVSGGKDASRGQYPHMALLGFGDSRANASWLCGGSVISERFILTAAHCVYSRDLGSIKFIALGILKRSDPAHFWQHYTVKRVIPHPEYRSPSKYHDIALLETDREIIFNDDVRPACLHVDGVADNDAIATGWGALGSTAGLSDVLQEVAISKFSDESCADNFPYHRHLINGYDNNTQMCYGDTTNSKTTDTCGLEQGEDILPNLIVEEGNSQAETKKNVSGRRIIDIDYFFSKMQELGGHGSFNCGIQSLKIIGEKRVGLASKFTLECLMCKEKFSVCNVTGDLDINNAAVAGAVSVGIGYSQLEELLSALDLPVMTEPVYQKRHDIVSDTWDKALIKSMNEAAEEEKNIAIENGRVSKDGIPIIDVVVDGCWSKRSYKKNYSALSGAAAIIGRHTKKILFLGIKNKYCSICAQDLNKNKNPRIHQCFKNFTGSSTAMESTIIVEGFKLSIEMYGLIYGRLISDGDSSTYAKILEARPYPQFTVEKVECRNHLLRNLCNKIENLITDTKYPIRFRKLITKKRIMAIRSAIRKCSKKYHDSLENIDFCTQKLFEDIQTVHFHAFNNHTKCKTYFCNSPQTEENVPQDFFTSALWQKICYFINTIAGHSRSLVHDVDSNIVESFHSVVAKFVGGKRINYSCRRGYQTRCSASAVNFNTKRKPVTILYKTIVGQSPKGKMNTLDKRYQKKRNSLKRLHYTKRQKHGALTKDGEHSYGEHSVKPDVSEGVLKEMEKTFLSNLEKTDEQREQIERRTILQSESSEWLELRRSLLTASNFGRIIKMRPDTSCASIVKQLLYKINIDATPIQHGRENEQKALDQLSRQEGVEIRPCGLFLDPEIPYLGATPDGLIGEDTIVEVKCPLSAFKMGLEEAIAQKKLNFWVANKSGTLEINKSHNWYYQAQGQLHVTRKNKCLFGVWVSELRPLKVELIDRDDDFFENKMRVKLSTFYLNCILPELLDPRHSRNMPIRDPPYILEAIKKKEDRKNRHNLEDWQESDNYDLQERVHPQQTPLSSPISEQPTCSRYLNFKDF